MISDQWIRKVNLVAFGDSKGVDLSNLHIEFHVQSAEVESPDNAVIRVYNLAPSTVSKIGKEFSRISLNAGYETGNYGMIFSGNIRQVKKGKLASHTSYIDIYAADGDFEYNNGVVNETFVRGATSLDQLKTLAKSMNGSELQTDKLLLDNQHLPTLRGSVLFGMSRARMRNVVNGIDCSWTIKNGKIIITPLTAYNDSNIIELNSKTGLIGYPEQTDGGIMVKCLLNSKIRVGNTIKINNADITQLQLQDSVFGTIPINQRAGFIPLAAISSADGLYKVYAIDYDGDTRSGPWYNIMTCLVIDPSSNPSKAVSKI